MPSSTPVQITKANGVREPFNAEKLHRSLVRSGASPAVADRITDSIAHTLTGGERTKDIYARAFTALRREKTPTAARYSVKRALLELGPSGYPFEDFLAEIFRTRGYEAQTRTVRRGACVEHELDLLAVRNGEWLGAEAKYHNNVGVKSDLKVALYVHARFLDLANVIPTETTPPLTTQLLITNTKFSSQAVAYAECVGMRLISWDYPQKGNLRELIEEAQVHPLSCLTTLSTAHKRRLMVQSIVLCKQIREQHEALRALGLSPADMAKVLEEAHDLCTST